MNHDLYLLYFIGQYEHLEKSEIDILLSNRNSIYRLIKLIKLICNGHDPPNISNLINSEHLHICKYIQISKRLSWQ